MQRRLTLILAAALLAISAQAAFGQADAKEAYQQAKAAYQAGNFAQARDLAKKASETDPKNPEVFLLLGKAAYQLGELDAAVGAWKQTLALAPEEPFAKKMLEVLQARRTDVDTRIKLVEVMIAENLHAAAAQECAGLLADKSLSDAQRAKVLTLRAEAVLAIGQPAETLRLVQEALTLYPKQADPLQSALLLGQAKIRSGGEATADGLAVLAKLIAENDKTPAAATARFELAAFDLKEGVTAARADVLAKWIADNPKSRWLKDARRALVPAYLTLTQQGGKAGPASALSETDAKALALLGDMAKQGLRETEAVKLVDDLIKHLEAYYGAVGAHAAALNGVETLLAAPLPRPARLVALKAMVVHKNRIAGEWLNEQARRGTLPVTAKPGALPPVLAEVLTAYQAIRNEYPAEPLWAEQGALAAQVRTFAGRAMAADAVTQLRGPDVWAIDIALPIVKANGDANAAKAAADLILGVIPDYASQDNPAARLLPLMLSRTLLSAPLSPKHASWAGAMLNHAKLLDAYAKYQFNENIKAGNAELNAKLSDTQKELLDTLAQLVAADAPQAAAAMKLAGEHVQPWTANRQWVVAEEVLATVAKALPAADRRQGELAVVGLWVQQVMREHARLQAIGLTIPRKLDPTLTKALVRLYELQAGLEADSPALGPIRAAWDGIVAHYKTLEYDDIAEAAIAVKAEKAVDAADEYAAFQAIALQHERAAKEFARLLKSHVAADQVPLTPGFKAVLAAWTKFITDRPTSRMTPQAVERVFGIGRVYEQQGAFAVAAGIYGDLAKFAAGVKVLAQATPGGASVAQRAAFTQAAALDALARKVLAKAAADRKPDEPPPAKLSDEFTAAIAAYKAFIEANPESTLVGESINKVLAVAIEYARIDSWDVADSVFADLLKSNLKIRRPERLEFARGVCQLGRAMPDHAREVLSLLISTGLRGSSEPTDPAMLAGLVGGAGFAMGDTGGDRSGGGLAVGGGGAKPAGESKAGGAPGASSSYTAATAPRTPPAAEPAPTVGGLPADSGGTLTGTWSLSADEKADSLRDSQLLAAIRKQESSRAVQVAQLREKLTYNQPMAQQADQQGKQQAPVVPVLSEAELARQEKALAAAYDIFQAVRKNYAETTTAEQARAEILVMVGHWRGLSEWQRSAALALEFLADNPTDRQLPQLRLEVARDRLSWAAKPIAQKLTKQAMLAEVSKRFAAARAELAKIVADFPKEKGYQQAAQWDIANSFLTEARVVGALSPTLARGQFVRAARELHAVAVKHPSHPQIGSIPQLLWGISQELEARGFDEEAIVVWNELRNHDPLAALAQEAAAKIAQTYQQKLKRPLKAAEAFQELNFARGGNDQNVQNAIFQIGSDLRTQKRWVEALHVLETFADSFPKHPQAGQALTMAGQIHQTNEAWKEAIAAYRRVIAEYPGGQWVQEAKWSIAECTINLSQWNEAAAAYRDYVAAYPQDAAKVQEGNRRIEVLKDLVRYQGLVDEKGQRKAFDAQYQIAVIVRNQLSNPVKAIIEYRKVVANWPESYVAAPALYEMGTAFLSLGDTEKARESLQQVAQKYPTSPLAGDAMFMVGKSYEEEADKLASVTRETSLERNKELAQRGAYEQVRDNRMRQQELQGSRVSSLKSAGKGKEADIQVAANAFNVGQFNDANVQVFAQQAEQQVETLTATQLADRQDKINAALRKAVAAYTATSKITGGNKADAALLQMATIYDQRLKDSKSAMETWLEIVRQFSGTAVAEDASWKIAQFYDRAGEYTKAIDAYGAFLRNYRRSPNAGPAQFAIAECYEHLGQWVNAMDSYTNYVNSFPEGPQVAKAKAQINWIKTYRL